MAMQSEPANKHTKQLPRELQGMEFVGSSDKYNSGGGDLYLSSQFESTSADFSIAALLDTVSEQIAGSASITRREATLDLGKGLQPQVIALYRNADSTFADPTAYAETTDKIVALYSLMLRSVAADQPSAVEAASDPQLVALSAVAEALPQAQIDLLSLVRQAQRMGVQLSAPAQEWLAKTEAESPAPAVSRSTTINTQGANS